MRSKVSPLIFKKIQPSQLIQYSRELHMTNYQFYKARKTCVGSLGGERKKKSTIRLFFSSPANWSLGLA
jgi:hypothetical protein